MTAGEASHAEGPPGSLFATSSAAGARLPVLVMHGVNLSQLQARKPFHYGGHSLADLLADLAREHPTLDTFTSDHEGALVERLHAARSDGTGAVVVNPGALTHSSYGLRDALEMLTIPKAEVHLSHTFAREPFRHHSTISPVVDVTITGLGALGYRQAIRMLLRLVAERPA